MEPGAPYPLGLSVSPQATQQPNFTQENVGKMLNFAVSSSAVAGMSLCLFDMADGSNTLKPIMEIALDPSINRTGTVWHVCIPMPATAEEFLWGWRATPPDDIDWTGGRILEDAILLDPYAQYVTQPSPESSSSLPHALHDVSDDGTVKFTLPDGSFAYGLGYYAQHSTPFDWDEDARPQYAADESVLYEIDVRLFTGHKTSGLPKDQRGTIGGVLSKIDYLIDLGVTTIILSPLMTGIEAGRGPMSFFGISQYLSASQTSRGAAEELKELVRECHKQNIEVLLDFPVTNTFDGSDEDPRCASWRGLDPVNYYHQDGDSGIRTSNLNWRNVVNQVICTHKSCMRVCVSMCVFIFFSKKNLCSYY